MEGVRAKIEERHERRRQEKYSSSHPEDDEKESQQPDPSLSTSALTAEERAELERQQDMKERDERIQHAQP
jgi:hypothetical protein